MAKYRVTTLEGRPVARGDVIHDFRGLEWAFGYVIEGAIDTGKIVVTRPGASMADGYREFFPSAFPSLSVSRA